MTEEVVTTTEASLPEQRVTTMEEHLNNVNNVETSNPNNNNVDTPNPNNNNLDTCNLNNNNSDTRYHVGEQQRVFDFLLEELNSLDDTILKLGKRLVRQYFPEINEPEAGRMVAAAIRMVYLQAKKEEREGLEAKCNRLDEATKDIKRRTVAMLFSKWRSVVSDKLVAVGREGEGETNSSKKLDSLTRKAERAEKRLARQQVRLDAVLAEGAVKERDYKDAQRRWKASKKRLESLRRSKSKQEDKAASNVRTDMRAPEW